MPSENISKRGRPRKIAPESITVEEESLPQAKQPTKMVEAQHIIKYTEPVAVPVTESEESQSEDEDDSIIFEDDEQERRRPKRVKSVREKIQEKLKTRGIGFGDRLYLRIDRMPLYEAGETGMGAEKEFCWRGGCTVEYITSDEYLSDTAKRYGAGTYWYTLRHGNLIVGSWAHKIGGIPQIATSTQDPMTGQPQITYHQIPQIPQQNGQQQTPQAIDPVKFLRQSFSVVKEFQEVLGINHNQQPVVVQPAPESQLNPEAQVLNVIAKSPGFIEDVISKFTDKGEREPTLTELMFKHGADLFTAAGNMIQGVIRTAAEEFKQVREIQSQNGSLYNNVKPHMGEVPDSSGQNRVETLQNSQRNLTEKIPNREQRTPMTERQEQRQQTPEDALLSIVLDGCSRNLPGKIVSERIHSLCEFVEENAPAQSLYGYVDMFTEQPSDQIISLCQTGILGEQGKQMSALPHAQEWIESLQNLLKQSDTEENQG